MVDEDANSDVLAGIRVLIIEDEALIAMLLEDVLDELGCSIVGTAGTLKHALALAADADVDVAILDVNLGGEPVFPVAEHLLSRNIPIIFATGYGVGGMPERWQAHVTLPKPFMSDQVRTVLIQALGL